MPDYKFSNSQILFREDRSTSNRNKNFENFDDARIPTVMLKLFRDCYGSDVSSYGFSPTESRQKKQ